PASFNKYFWDVKPKELSVEKNADYIIERLLELGDLEQLEWLNNTYSKEKIVNTLQHSKRLTPKTCNFFSLYYNVPRESLTCTKQRLL
ncbi:MAG: hypothetical protein ABIH84_00155, partial [bacterium]